MKVIFALGDKPANDNYLEYARVAVYTAKECGYEAVLLHDGDTPDISVPKVQIRSRFFSLMEKHLRTDELSIARGAMLRLEIPFVFTDDVVLYADLDTVVCKRAIPPTVRYWGMVREAPNSVFNSGVSVMNLPGLRATAPWFHNFCQQVIESGNLPRGAWDQGLINSFYGGTIDEIPDEWNWRPYQGSNDNKIVLHFHGPKPLDLQSRLDKEYPRSLWPEQYYRDKDAWLNLQKTMRE